MTTASAPGGEPTIRPASRADLLAVFRIEKRSFPTPWPYAAFETFLGEPGFLVATDPGSDVVTGYVIADVVPNHGRDLGHIKDLAVHPDRRERGVGSALLSRAMRVLTDRSVASVKLEVRESNEPARSLYRRFGFEPLRTVSAYYDNGEDAVVMVRRLEDGGN